MVQQQQAMGKRRGLVSDGRDIGTVVFPDAELKIFLIADADVRTSRRHLELAAKGIDAEWDDIRRNLLDRDRIDSSRADSPLRRADDGLVENVPISPLKQQNVDFTIAVDVGANRRFQKPENIMDVIANSISISIRQSTRTQLRQADLVIAPDMTARSRVNMQQVRELAKVGYDEAMNRLGQVTAAPSLMSRMKKQLANWGKSE